MKILIVGAGIGGLTAAICLSRQGHDVTVFEKTSCLLEVGAGVQLGANALCVLDDLGLMDQISACAVQPERVEFREFDTGKILHTAIWGQHYERQYGAPYFHLYRADLQRILLNALHELNPAALKLNAPVSNYEECASKVEIFLSDGQIFTGDCLIAADGLKSSIKRQMLDKSTLQFSGYVAWRGVVARKSLPENFMPKIASNFVGQQKHMVMYYLRGQALVNFVGVMKASDKEPRSADQSWVTKAPLEALQKDFHGWHPMVEALIDKVSPDECYRWRLYDQKPSTTWSSQRVTLLGDAAHACLPFMASGAAMAIEDAMVLSRAINKKSTLAGGLLCYQNNRLERTKKVQKMSRQAGILYHLPTRLLRQTAFSLLKFRPESADAWLAEYNANSSRLD